MLEFTKIRIIIENSALNRENVKNVKDVKLSRGKGPPSNPHLTIFLNQRECKKKQIQKSLREKVLKTGEMLIKTLRAKGTLISEPRFSTPCEMRFFPREKGKTAFSKFGIELGSQK